MNDYRKIPLMSRMLRVIWWFGLVALFSGTMASGACNYLGTHTCSVVIFDPMMGWIALTGVWLLLPALIADAESRFASLPLRVAVAMGYGLLILRAVYVSAPRTLLSHNTGDFNYYYHGMHTLLAGGNPYTFQGAVTFPLPAFFIYQLVSVNGSLSESSAYLVLWISNLIILSVLPFLIARLWQKEVLADTGRRTLLALMLIGGGWEGLAHGQTTIMTAMCVCLFLLGRDEPSIRRRLGARFALALAIMLKPYLILALLVDLLQALLGRDRRLMLISLAVPVFIAGLIGSSVIIVGGVGAQTYFQFAQNLKQLGNPAGITQTAFSGGISGNISPAGAALFVGHLVFGDRSVLSFSTAASMLTLVGIVYLSLITTLVFRSRVVAYDRKYVLHLWIVSSICIWQVAYTHYVLWLIPSLCVLSARMCARRRCALMVLLALFAFDIGWIGALALVGIMALCSTQIVPLGHLPYGRLRSIWKQNLNPQTPSEG